MPKNNLFMVGGAKGVGKTRLTLDVASQLEMGRIETGQLVFEYITLGLPLDGLTDYITNHICSQSQDLILDTHYARYSDRVEVDKRFMRGLEREDLERVMEVFRVNPCLVEVPIDELERRRRADAKRRVIEPIYVQQEMDFNRRGYELYLEETSSNPFVLVNSDYDVAKEELRRWISRRIEENGK